MRKLLAAGAVLLTALTGCAVEDAPDSTSLSGRITVFAAASLTDTFTELGEQFEAEHGVTVNFSFAGSSALAQQITDGAPADAFASASPVNMDQVADFTADPVVFVANRLQIAVPAGNPGGVTGLADFADEALSIAICQEQVPCGQAAETVFAAADITPAPDTLEQDVKAVLTKVRLGEVDAGLVYRTDVIAAGEEVEGIDFDEAAQAINDYPIATLTQAPNPDAAKAFVEFVLSQTGRTVFTDAGFDVP